MPVWSCTRERLPLLLLFLAALSLRIVFSVQFGGTPLGRTLILDADHYDRMAATIAAGHIIGEEPYFVEPLYSFVLAGIYTAFGRHWLPVRLIQSTAGAFAALLVCIVASRLYGKKAGFAAGTGAALYGPLVFYDAMLLKTSFEVLAGILWCWLLVRRHKQEGVRYWFVCGLVLGIASLLKGNFLLLVPVGAICAMVKTEGRRLGALAAFLAAVLLALLPVIARNSILANEPAFITTGAGMNFYQGNRAGAQGGVDIPDHIKPDPAREQADSILEAERRTGRKLTTVEASRFWFQESLRYIRGNPGNWLKLMVRKVLMCINHFEATDNVSFYYARRIAPLLWVPFLGFSVVGVLGLAALPHAFWRRNDETVVAALATLWIFSVALFHVADRYRLPAVPLLIVLGAGLASRIAQALVRRNLRSLAQAAALVLGCWFLVNSLVFYPGGQEMGTMDMIMAQGLESEGKSNLAQTYYERAAKTFYYNGLTHLNEGRHHRAELYFRDALQARKDCQGASYHLGVALEKQGKNFDAILAYQEAFNQDSLAVESLVRLAMIFTKQGALDRARTALDLAAEREPARFEVLLASGEFLARKGDSEGAIRSFKEAYRTRPDATWLARRIAEMESRAPGP